MFASIRFILLIDDFHNNKIHYTINTILTYILIMIYTLFANSWMTHYIFPKSRAYIDFLFTYLVVLCVTMNILCYVVSVVDYFRLYRYSHLKPKISPNYWKDQILSTNFRTHWFTITYFTVNSSVITKRRRKSTIIYI